MARYQVGPYRYRLPRVTFVEVRDIDAGYTDAKGEIEYDESLGDFWVTDYGHDPDDELRAVGYALVYDRREVRLDGAEAVLIGEVGPHGYAISAEGLEKLSMAQVQRFLQGLVILRGGHDERGRPTGSGAYRDRSEFITATTHAIADLRRRHMRVTQSAVASDLAIDVSTLKRYLRRLGVTWAELKRQAA